MDKHYTYAALLIGSVFFPLILSFDKRVHFFRYWKYLPLPFFIAASFFLAWDHVFTKLGVWSFNGDYVLGARLLLMPLEEWFFFIVVPFACLFIYECLNVYIKKDWLGAYARPITGMLSVFLLMMGIWHIDKMYTAVNFISAALMLAIHFFLIRPEWLGRFYLGYLVSLFPFLLVNGVLTALPVVIYHPAENLGLFLYTIPVEDTVYLLLLLLMITTVYEYLKTRGKDLLQTHN